MKWSIFLSNLQQSSLRLPGTASLSSRMSSMSLNSGSASVGTNTALLAKECSSQTNASGATASYRAVGLGIHHSQPLVTAIAPDLDPLVHGPKSLSAHYASTFGYENSAYCPVILHLWLLTLPFSLIPLSVSFSLATTATSNAPHTAVSFAYAATSTCLGSCQFANLWVWEQPTTSTAMSRIRTYCHVQRHHSATLARRCPVNISTNRQSLLMLCVSNWLQHWHDSRQGSACVESTQHGGSLSFAEWHQFCTHPPEWSHPAEWLQGGDRHLWRHEEQQLRVSRTNSINITLYLFMFIPSSRYAKMWYKGVSFTSESCALIYLVDTAGTRTTTDTFTDLTKDYTLAVFYEWVYLASHSKRAPYSNANSIATRATVPHSCRMHRRWLPNHRTVVLTTAPRCTTLMAFASFRPPTVLLRWRVSITRASYAPALAMDLLP